MLAHYSHISLEAKRNALEALGGTYKVGGYGTNSDTMTQAISEASPQVIEINGRPVGTRFTILSLKSNWYAALQPTIPIQSLRFITLWPIRA
jgi:hypothetical protein